jgi:ATP-dependent Clp protease ATP-binding subunit ClpB
MDASNLLKPALARGNCIASAPPRLMNTANMSRRTRRLQRRFQPVFMAEPTVEDTISILRGIKDKYELHHGVRITDAAIGGFGTAVDRYITDRFLPDKAIDLMDEAASRMRMEVDSKPEEIEALDRRIIQLKIEESAAWQGKTMPRKTGWQALREELANLEQQSAEITTRWQNERDKIGGESRSSRKSSIRRGLNWSRPAQGDLAKRGRAFLRHASPNWRSALPRRRRRPKTPCCARK